MKDKIALAIASALTLVGATLAVVAVVPPTQPARAVPTIELAPQVVIKKVRRSGCGPLGQISDSLAVEIGGKDTAWSVTHVLTAQRCTNLKGQRFFRVVDYVIYFRLGNGRVRCRSFGDFWANPGKIGAVNLGKQDTPPVWKPKANRCVEHALIWRGPWKVRKGGDPCIDVTGAARTAGADEFWRFDALCIKT